MRIFTRALRDNQMVGVVYAPHLRTPFGFVTLIADVTVRVATRRQEPITATHFSQGGAGFEPKDSIGPSNRIYAASLCVHAPPINDTCIKNGIIRTRRRRCDSEARRSCWRTGGDGR